MKKNFRLIAIALALGFALSILFSAIAQVGLLDQPFNIPAQYGSVKETFKASDKPDCLNRTIIHIQDAHCNYEAQKNLAKILEYFVKEHNLRLIMVEGGSGNVSLSFLRRYADQKARTEIAEKYLKIGEISGEEYLDIISDGEFQLYGIDDSGLYDAHLVAFEKLDAVKEKGGMKYLEDLSQIMKQLKSVVYSTELKDLEDQKKGYEDKAISLTQYCGYLKDRAAQKRLDINPYANLEAFLQTSKLEKEIDFQEAEDQRNAFIKDLAQLLDKERTDGLIQMSQRFKAGEVSAKYYYSFLKESSAGKLDMAQDYPQLDAYIRYIDVSKDINVPALLKEIGLIEEKIKEAFFVNDEQRKLSEISAAIKILIRILNLELTPEEYAYFKNNRSKFITAPWVDFLSQSCQRYGLSLPIYTSSIIDDSLGVMEEFYKLGTAREEAFIRNAEDKMNDSQEKLAVLITGGFHTPGIAQMLKDKGYSYAVITPTITRNTDSDVYFSVLRETTKKSFTNFLSEEYYADEE